MPASMIMAACGCSVKVTGKRIEIVATGPRPGRTPIMVPSTTPTKPYSRLTGASATENPRPRLSKNSIAQPSEHEWFQGETETEPEQRADERDQAGGEQRDLDQAKVTVGQARSKHHSERGDDEAGALDQEAECQRSQQHEEQWPQRDAADRLAGDEEGTDDQDGAQQNESQTHRERIVARSHAGGGSDRIVPSIDDGEAAERNEQEPGQQVGR